ncbi:MAG TPA: MFS transporter [Terriglobales bacterium]|nr:MFS transporter [Terriglobales bacterium]
MRRTVGAIASILISVGCIDAALGLFSPVEVTQMTARGASDATIGLLSSLYYIGFLGGTWLCHGIIHRAGHPRALSLFVVVAANITLLHTITQSNLFWLAFSCATGFSLAGALVVVESWLNDNAEPETRGRFLGLYTAISWGASGIAPLALNIPDHDGKLLFTLAAMVMAAAVLPMSLTLAPSPEPEEKPRLNLLTTYRASPIGSVTCFAVGVLGGALHGMLPVYTEHLGWGYDRLSLLLSLSTVLAVAAQVPIGYLSDRMTHRPALIVISAVLIAAFCTGIFYLQQGGFLVFLGLYSLLLFIESPLYPLGASVANDAIDKSETVAMSSGLLFIWGLGASIGPFIVGQVMQYAGSEMLFPSIAVGSALLAMFTIWKISRRSFV